MADHFYSVATEGLAYSIRGADVTVGTAAASSNPIELRVTDGAVTAKDVHAFLENLSSKFGARDFRVIAAGTLTG